MPPKIYSRYKIFGYPEKIASLPRNNPEILSPLHLRIKPTNACNHACRYCAYRDPRLQLGQDMDRRDCIPWEKMQELIDDICGMGVKAVTFSGGGEPFVYPRLAEAASRLADCGVAVAALTNGGRLAGEAADVFAWRAAWLRVSMDGWDGPSYARYRGTTEDEFAKVLGNLEAFKKRGGPCRLGVSYIVDRDNYGHVAAMLARLKDIGVDSVKVSPCIIDNEGAVNNAYHQPFVEAVREQLAAATRLVDDAFEIFDAYHVMEEKFDKPYDWCPYCQILAVIGADLRVYPCQDKAYNLSASLGSIRDRRFREFWFADKEKFFAIRPREHCRHHCVANPKNLMLHEFLDTPNEHAAFV